MKIPNRLELSEQLNAQRKMEIDGGIYLATRVDKLRADLVELERQQKDFIAKNKDVIFNATQELLLEKSELVSNIAVLREQRKELLKPLNEEWNQLNNEKEKLLKDRESLDLTIKLTEDTQKEYEKRNEESVKEFQRADAANESAQKEFSLIHTRLMEVHDLYREAESLREKTERECREKIDLLIRKEQILDYDRKHYQDFEKETKKREKEIDLREKQLVIKELKLK